MKFTALFLIASFFQINANSTYTEDVKITLSLQNVSLERVLNRIETITDYKFVYKDIDIEYKKQVSIKVDKKSLDKVLDKLFTGTQINYTVSDKHIILKAEKKHTKTQLATPSTVAQKKFLVSGSVTDSNGLPLPGTTILEKGTSTGVTSDFDGFFSINVSSEKAILEASYIGFLTQDIPVNGQATLNIKMKENLAELDEVIVVGYGIQKKETVVGSVTQAKGEELLQAGSVATVSEALAGIMPGVSTMQAAGQPGSTASNILIRGQSTWTDNNPLFLVDGVERDFNDLDPNEIASISVLKDASATAVFGVKGANGVILVTTKRGKPGDTKVRFTSSWGLKKPTMNTDYYMDYATTLEHYNMAAMNDRMYGSIHPQSEIDAWRDPNRDKRFYSYTTWINELLTTGTSSQYNVNVSGGNDFVSYFASLGYQYDGDIFNIEKQKDFDPRTYQKKYNWRTNLDFNFSKTTKFKVGLAGNFKNWNGNSITNGTNGGIATGNGDAFTRIWQTPLIGTAPILEGGLLGTEAGATVNPNFYRMEKEGQWKRRSNTMYTDFTLTQDITKHVKAAAKLSYNYNQSYNSSIRRSLLYYYPNQDKTGFIQEGNPDAIQEPLRVNGESISGSGSSLYYEFRLNYNQTFGHHDVGAMALFNRRKAQNGVNFPRFEESWVGRATYAYKQKYLAEFNGAYNGNENWAPGLRFGFFPSMAAGWVVSREEFMKKNLDFVSFLKLRYSYGEIGSDKGIGNTRFLYQSTYDKNGSNNASFYYGDPVQNYGPLYIEGKPATPDNTWEKAIKQDLAVEFGFLNNKLKGAIEFFDEKRNDIIMERRTVAPWYGNTAPRANIGRTKNHGIDVELKYNSRIGEDIKYFVKANMSISESRVIERDDPTSTAPQQRLAGKPIGWASGHLHDGLYQSWDDVYNSTISSYSSDLIPGSLNFIDYNGDGIIDQFDKVPINDPSYAAKSYAFSLGFTYKNFSVHALFNGMFDISKNLSSLYLFEYSAAATSSWQLLNNEQLNAWSPTNPNGTHPALHTVSNTHDQQASTYTNRSSTFLRFKTMEIKYNLDKKLLDKIGLFDSFEIYVNGNNLATWSDLPDEFDPEQRHLNVYPLTQRFNLGVRLSF
ncbi:TonB-dependent receptor [Flavicella sediminum]|uniref:TonB-dependent receptor n=1 Tax=Flavicella sediminum TaxID=2585141 RepID=UPI00140A0868|nr:TonB-dependent receptor [Flavicella sediminum]